MGRPLPLLPLVINNVAQAEAALFSISSVTAHGMTRPGKTRFNAVAIRAIGDPAKMNLARFETDEEENGAVGGVKLGDDPSQLEVQAKIVFA
jgi:hypothetical protein